MTILMGLILANIDYSEFITNLMNQRVNLMSRFLVLAYKRSHLSKGSSDLKQNGTQEKTPFSGTVSPCLSYGVVLFVLTVSFWNHQIEASHWLKEEF